MALKKTSVVTLTCSNFQVLQLSTNQRCQTTQIWSFLGITGRWHRRTQLVFNIYNVFPLSATIPTFTYGIQIGWLSPMGPLLKSDATPAQAPLTEKHISWMAAALPLAGIAGIPFFSYASDRFGRKICVILVSMLSCVSIT